MNAIQLFILKKSISKALKDREGKKILNFDTAKKIGVVFTVTNTSNINSIKEFIQLLVNKKTKVQALGWTDADKIPENAYESIHFAILTKKDLNFWGIPANEKYDHFKDQKFDILIDLTWEPNIISSYLSAHTDAYMKVGRESDESLPVFDLLIRVNEKEKQPFFFKQIIHYLSTIDIPQSKK